MRRGFSLLGCVALISAVVILSIYIGYYFFIPWLVCGGETVSATHSLSPWDKCGVFGDSYGALTCLFSALAFWGALITLYMQYLQRSDDKHQQALENLPVVVKIPKSGMMTAGLTTSGVPFLNLVFILEECNTSTVTALNLAHKTSLSLAGPSSKVWFRRLNYANNLQNGRPTIRNESFAIFGVEGVSAVLEALLASKPESFPIFTNQVSYRNIFDCYAVSLDMYRIKLKDRMSNIANIRKLVVSLTDDAKPKIEDMEPINGVELVLSNIAEKSILEASTKKEYESYCRNG